MHWLRLALTGTFAVFVSLAGPTAASAQAPAQPRIIVLATGGTIAGQASNRAAIGYDAGKVSGQTAP